MPSIKERLKAAFTPGLQIDVDPETGKQREDVFTPGKDLWQLIAADSGIATGRMRRGALEAAAEHALIMQTTDNVFRQSLDEQLQASATPQDVAQLRILGQQWDRAQLMMNSRQPELREQGNALAAQLLDAQRAYGVKQEEQAIEQQAAENAARVALGDERFDRYTALHDDLYRESVPFITTQRSAQTYWAMDSTTPMGQLAKLRLATKVLTPNEAFMADDLANALGARSYTELFEVWGKSLADGDLLSDKQMRDLDAVVREAQRAANREQQARNEAYSRQGNVAGLPESYLNELQIPIDEVIGRTMPPAEVRTVTVDELLNRTETTTTVAGGGAVAGGIAGALSTFATLMEDASAYIRGDGLKGNSLAKRVAEFPGGDTFENRIANILSRGKGHLFGKALVRVLGGALTGASAGFTALEAVRLILNTDNPLPGETDEAYLQRMNALRSTGPYLNPDLFGNRKQRETN